MATENHLTTEELEIVAEAAALGFAKATPAAQEVCSKYLRHALAGCSSCPKRVEVLRMVSRAADRAVERVISRLKAEGRIRAA